MFDGPVEQPGDLRAAVTLISRLYDVTLDDCRACREPLLDLFAQDAATTARLVHWASGSTTEILGYMHDDLLEARVPELEPLTALVRAWWLPREVPRHRLSLLRDGHNPLRDIYIPCRKLTPEVRRRVAE